MSVNTRRMAIRFLAFGILGLALEVTATSFSHADRLTVRGLSSPWMLPIYGLIGVVFEPISGPLRRRRVPYLLRAAVYMLAIFAVEYASGMFFLAVGLNRRGAPPLDTVWDYSTLPYNLHGQIVASCIPSWYGLGLVLEPLYRWVDAGATAVALHVKPGDLLAASQEDEG